MVEQTKRKSENPFQKNIICKWLLKTWHPVNTVWCLFRSWFHITNYTSPPLVLCMLNRAWKQPTLKTDVAEENGWIKVGKDLIWFCFISNFILNLQTETHIPTNNENLSVHYEHISCPLQNEPNINDTQIKARKGTMSKHLQPQFILINLFMRLALYCYSATASSFTIHQGSWPRFNGISNLKLFLRAVMNAVREITTSLVRHITQLRAGAAKVS